MYEGIVNVKYEMLIIELRGYKRKIWKQKEIVRECKLEYSKVVWSFGEGGRRNYHEGNTLSWFKYKIQIKGYLFLKGNGLELFKGLIRAVTQVFRKERQYWDII